MLYTRFWFIFFTSSKLPQVLSLPLILYSIIFFGGGEDFRKMAWIKWDIICLQRESGGLWVKRLMDFNVSLLGKWVWRVLEERESLWYKVFPARYGEVGGRLRFGGGERSF